MALGDDDWASDDEAGQPKEAGGGEAPSPSKKKATKRLLRRRSSASGGASKKVKKTAAKKKGAPKGARRAACFIMACEMKVKNNSKFCHQHFNVHAGLRSQAAKSGKLDVFEQAFSKVESATRACEDWDEANPPGTFRKALVDWHQFEKRHGHRVAITYRGEDTLMSNKYFRDWKLTKGIAEAEADLEWAEHLKTPGMDGEGSGSSRMLYICKERKRLRDETQYVDAALKEGGKQQKNMSEKERGTLKQFTQKAASFSNIHMANFTGSSSVNVDDGDAKEAEGSEEDDDLISLHAPAAFTLHSKQIDVLTMDMKTAVEMTTVALQAFEDMDPTIVTKDLESYHDLCIVRQHQTKYVDARTSVPVIMPAGCIFIEMPAPEPGSIPLTPAALTPGSKPDPLPGVQANAQEYILFLLCRPLVRFFV